MLHGRFQRLVECRHWRPFPGCLFRVLGQVGIDDRLEIELIKPGVNIFRQRHAQPFTDSSTGFPMAHQIAGNQRIEAHVPFGKILAKPPGLLMAKLRETVIVIGAERCLSVADKIELGHVESLQRAREQFAMTPA